MTDSAATRALSPPARPGSRGRPRLPSRIVPKREAALSASAMTVNVEFSGTGVGRSVTSTYSAHPEREDSISILAKQALLPQPAAPRDPARSVMGIFAGAPRTEEGVDPWVVIPRAQRSAPVPAVTVMGAQGPGPATLGRSAMRHASRLSRVVDAVIDSPGGQGAGAEGEEAPFERTLSRRAHLSDSSIHTTFMGHAEEQSPRRRAAEGGTLLPPEQDRQSVFAAIGRRMQSFRFAGPAGPVEGPNADAGSRPETPVSASQMRERAHTPTRASAPRDVPNASGLLQSFAIASWATPLDLAQDGMSSPYYAVGSPREEAFQQRTWNRERDM